VDACRGIDRRPGDVVAALAELEQRGVRLQTSAEVLACRSPATG
jgi:hypothetical protein